MSLRVTDKEIQKLIKQLCTQCLTVELLKAMGCKIEEVEHE